MHFAQECGDGFALVEPLPAQANKRLVRLGLVERDEARRPAIGKIQMIERVEDSGACGIGKSQNGERAHMPVAQHRLDAAA